MLKNLQGRSATLDIHAVGGDHKEFDVEIQRSDAGAKRARHNSSLLDAHILKPGEKTADIPDSYVIFITENDVMGKRQAVYHIQRYVETDGGMELFGDGSHIIYVNGTYRGSDEIGKLMHDFSCTDPEDMNYEVLAKRVRHFKQEEKGVAAMCRLLEEMRNEAAREAAEEAAKEAKKAAEKAAKEAEEKAAKETAERMIRKGKLPLEEIADYVPLLSFDELRQLEAGVMELA